MNKSLLLELLEECLAICRLPGDASYPDWIDPLRFYSGTRSDDELSVVCGEAFIPSGIKAEKDWGAIKVTGARIPVFVISAYDTDYQLVKSGKLMQAKGILSESHKINSKINYG